MLLEGLVLNGAAREIADVCDEALSNNASALARDVSRENECLRHDVDRLYMIVEALWEMLKTHAGCTDADLTALVQQIDLRDGKLDGCAAQGKARSKCPRCGRTLLSAQPYCPWCGSEVSLPPFSR